MVISIEGARVMIGRINQITIIISLLSDKLSSQMLPKDTNVGNGKMSPSKSGSAAVIKWI